MIPDKDFVLTAVIVGATGYAGFVVLQAAVDLNGRPGGVFKGIDLASGLNMSLPMLGPGSSGALIVVVFFVSYLVVRGGR